MIAGSCAGEVAVSSSGEGMVIGCDGKGWIGAHAANKMRIRMGSENRDKISSIDYVI